MTDINNKKKRPLGGLAWLLALITVAGLAFIFWPRTDDSLQLRKKRTTNDSIALSINAYLQWAQKADESQMSNDHKFIATGLNKMATALDALSKRNATSQEQIHEEIAIIRSSADSVTRHSGNTDHSRILRSAFVAAKETMRHYQESSFPDLEDELSAFDRSISKLNQNKLLLEQADIAIELFKQSAVILRDMNSDPAKSAISRAK